MTEPHFALEEYFKRHPEAAAHRERLRKPDEMRYQSSREKARRILEEAGVPVEVTEAPK